MHMFHFLVLLKINQENFGQIIIYHVHIDYLIFLLNERLINGYFGNIVKNTASKTIF